MVVFSMSSYPRCVAAYPSGSLLSNGFPRGFVVCDDHDPAGRFSEDEVGLSVSRVGSGEAQMVEAEAAAFTGVCSLMQSYHPNNGSFCFKSFKLLCARDFVARSCPGGRGGVELQVHYRCRRIRGTCFYARYRTDERCMRHLLYQRTWAQCSPEQCAGFYTESATAILFPLLTFFVDRLTASGIEGTNL